MRSEPSTWSRVLCPPAHPQSELRAGDTRLQEQTQENQSLTVSLHSMNLILKEMIDRLMRNLRSFDEVLSWCPSHSKLLVAEKEKTKELRRMIAV
jgi:hypothetical protein